MNNCGHVDFTDLLAHKYEFYTMVQVTFNEKVECHHYNPHPDGIQPHDRNQPVDSASSSVQRQSRLHYNRRFLKNLRDAPLSRVCPDVVKKGEEEEKGWSRNAPDTVEPSRPFNKGTVFVRQPNSYNNSNYTRLPSYLCSRSQQTVFHLGQRRPLIPFFSNNQNNFAGYNRDDVFTPLEPIGSRRSGAAQSKHYPSRNYAQDYTPHFTNRNLLPDFAQGYDGRTSSEMRRANDEETEPEWSRYGPTSPNDCIELHGFDGPGSQENHENQPKNDHLGCIDGNISGGPTSGASSNNGSPPAKSTPAKVTSASLNGKKLF